MSTATPASQSPPSTVRRIAVVGHVEHVTFGRAEGVLSAGDIVHLRDVRFLPAGAAASRSRNSAGATRRSTSSLAHGLPVEEACRRAGPYGAAVLRGIEPLEVQGEAGGAHCLTAVAQGHQALSWRCARHLARS